jgi:hypothetical protein
MHCVTAAEGVTHPQPLRQTNRIEAEFALESAASAATEGDQSLR